jgi:hypothetical protein
MDSGDQLPLRIKSRNAATRMVGPARLWPEPERQQHDGGYGRVHHQRNVDRQPLHWLRALDAATMFAIRVAITASKIVITPTASEMMASTSAMVLLRSAII